MTITDEAVKTLIHDLSNIEEIEAILLGGSHGSGTAESDSDYDIYVYSFTEIPLVKRKKVLSRHFKIIEWDNRYWETEDDGILFSNSIPVDIIYRSIEWLDDILHSIVIDNIAWIGYTTCLWYNLINSIILFDRNGKLTELQKKYQIPYPDKLSQNIIKKNRDLLKGKLPSYYDQIKKAIHRNDLISIQHRLTAFFSSYFDILFALNRQLHPGEKKMVEKVKALCSIIPNNFEQHIQQLLHYSNFSSENLLTVLENCIEELDLVLMKF